MTKHSPDNAACEGFWGCIKNECFYGRSFSGYSIEEFIAYIYQYIDLYNSKRVKLSLLGQSPMKFRQLDGSMVRAIL
ncbi:IS3 family transposase [Lacrimispora brassicae]